MGFKFKDRICVIEIEDVKYSVIFQQPLVDKLKNARDCFTRLKEEGADNDKACAAFDNAIDEILGKGASERIFAERFPNIMERYAILKYIYDEITEFMKKIESEANVQKTFKNPHNRRSKNSY